MSISIVIYENHCNVSSQLYPESETRGELTPKQIRVEANSELKRPSARQYWIA